jgi:hypothetical protein
VIIVPKIGMSLNNNRLDSINHIEQQWRDRKINDPVMVMLMLERSRIGTENSTYTSTLPLSLWIIPVGMIPMIPALILRFWNIWFPAYNFCWGEYVRVFERRQAQARFIFGGVLLVVLLGLLINFLSKKLF